MTQLTGTTNTSEVSVRRSRDTLTRLVARRPLVSTTLLSGVMTVALLVRDRNDGPAWRVSLAVVAAVALAYWLVVGVAVKRAIARQSATVSSRRALLLGAATVLSVIAFWLALPPVFAVATLALVVDARDRSTAILWPVKVGSVLAWLGLLAGLILAVVG